MFVDFQKQYGREEVKHLDDDEYYLPGDVENDPAPFNPRKPRNDIAIDFGKGPERFPNDTKMHDIEEELVLDVKYPNEKKLLNLVKMDAGEPRFKVKLPEDPFYEDQPLNELNCDVIHALNAVRPGVKGGGNF